ncbi:CHC2 zinc finger domain-containing protein [Nocardia terpenica]|uniref:CHC2 zinc finger domain-containing protein n=1 Tax=Nocardia terpenica TaxID=455432 RepID=UPI0038CD6BFA
MSTSPIVRVIRTYYPDFESPDDRGREWVKVLCPFHGESHPSASISYQHNAFICYACGVKGDVYSLIMREEGVSFAEAKRLAEKISPDSDHRIREESRRQPGRRVFGEPRFARPELAGQGFSPRVRRKPPPWA